MAINEIDFKGLAKKFAPKLSKIKLALFDVDGILTDGKVYFSGEEVGWNRSFHTHDGYGLKVLMNAGIKVGIITGGNSLGVKKRFSMLGVDFIYMGDEDKRHAYTDVQNKTKFKDEEILYMGDEFFDIPLLKRAGFSATAPHASLEVKDVVDYVTTREGGEACVREVIDILRYVQGIVPQVEDFEGVVK